MPLKKERKTGIQPKDMVLSKMTGFPAWPSFVMPPDMIPRAIMKAKKKTTNVCVIFIPDGDYNWMNEKSLELLSPEKLQTRLGKLPKDKLKPKPKKKAGRTNNVADALVAANGLDFDNFMEDLARQNKADDDDDDDDEDEEEEDDEIEDNADEEDGENEAGADDAEDAEEDAEDADEAEAGSPSGDEPSEIADDHIDELSDDKNGHRLSTDDETKENSTSERKRTRNGMGARKEAKTAHGDKENHTNGDKNGTSKPASEKDRQHQLWLCRIKLQRSLIQRNQPVTPKDPREYPAPTVDELSVARIILHRLADFPVTVELLRETKIHKVLKCILKDGDLEYPDSFRLHEKCEELLQKWKTLIENLKQEKQAKLESRLSSQVPEESQLLSNNS